VRIGKIEIKRRVWIGLASALVVTGVWWNTARVRPPVAVAATPAKAPFVRVVSVGTEGAGNQILHDKMELMDPAPLFFPTKWNFGQRPLGENMLREPGQVFGSFPPSFTFADPNLKAYGNETAAAPERLADVVVRSDEAPFAGMGQIDMQRPALAERSAFLEIKDVANGKNVAAQPLGELSLPRTDFAPLEFLVVVGSAGIIGNPILTNGSGWEDVDTFFRTYLVKSFHLGERLNPGRYRVLVGP